MVLVSGLHEDSFGLQPITFSAEDKFTWNSTLQVWMMLVGIVGDVFGTTLEDRHGGMRSGNLGLGLVTSKKLWTI